MAVAHELEIDVEPSPNDDEVVLHLRGALDLSEVSLLRATLAQACELERGDVILDLRELGFLGSSGMSAMLRAHRVLADQGRQLVLRAAPRRIRRALEITRLDQILILDEMV